MACVSAVSRSRVAAPFRSSRAARTSVVVAVKPGIHPEWYGEAKVFCNGVEVMTVGGTKKEYNVDIYSGNHPFYQGNKAVMVLDEGQLNKFKKRFADLDDVFAVSTNTGKIQLDENEPKAKGGKAGKGKKK